MTRSKESRRRYKEVLTIRLYDALGKSFVPRPYGIETIMYIPTSPTLSIYVWRDLLEKIYDTFQDRVHVGLEGMLLRARSLPSVSNTL